MGEIPEIDKVFLGGEEDCLLDFHLDFYYGGLEVIVDFGLTGFY